MAGMVRVGATQVARHRWRDTGGLLRQLSVYQSVEDRDGYIQSGMERGVNDSMERLDELLARLAPLG